MKGCILSLILCAIISAFGDQTLVRASAVSQDITFSIPTRLIDNLRGSEKTGHDIIRQDFARALALFGDSDPAESPFLPPGAPDASNMDAGVRPTLILNGVYLLIIFQLFGVIMDIQIGNGNYTILIDSGSSNSWIGSNRSHPYLPSDQSRDIGKDFNVTYGSGNVTGSLCKKSFEN